MPPPSLGLAVEVPACRPQALSDTSEESRDQAHGQRAEQLDWRAGSPLVRPDSTAARCASHRLGKDPREGRGVQEVAVPCKVRDG